MASKGTSFFSHVLLKPISSLSCIIKCPVSRCESKLDPHFRIVVALVKNGRYRHPRHLDSRSTGQLVRPLSLDSLRKSNFWLWSLASRGCRGQNATLMHDVTRDQHAANPARGMHLRVDEYEHRFEMDCLSGQVSSGDAGVVRAVPDISANSLGQARTLNVEVALQPTSLACELCRLLTVI
jgi:hypothetical protein